MHYAFCILHCSMFNGQWPMVNDQSSIVNGQWSSMFWAERCERALVTSGTLAFADVTPMKQEPVVGITQQFRWYIPDQFLFHFQWRISCLWHQPEPVADPKDMGIYRHCGLPECYGKHDVRSLASHSRQSHQGIHIVRHYAAIIADYLLRQLHEVTRFCVGVADALDVFQHLALPCPTHCFCIRIGLKERRGHHIDALVRALGRKDHSHQELELRLPRQLCSCHWLTLMEIIDNRLVSLFSGHSN